MGAGGSKCTMWKWLDTLPEGRVKVGMDVSGVMQAKFGCEEGIGEATWERYFGYGWVSKNRTLSQKGYDEWTHKRTWRAGT